VATLFDACIRAVRFSTTLVSHKSDDELRRAWVMQINYNANTKWNTTDCQNTPSQAIGSKATFSFEILI
jgi:hypothetical protein